MTKRMTKYVFVLLFSALFIYISNGRASEDAGSKFIEIEVESETSITLDGRNYFEEYNDFFSYRWYEDEDNPETGLFESYEEPGYFDGPILTISPVKPGHYVLILIASDGAVDLYPEFFKIICVDQP